MNVTKIAKEKIDKLLEEFSEDIRTNCTNKSEAIDRMLAWNYVFVELLSTSIVNSCSNADYGNHEKFTAVIKETCTMLGETSQDKWDATYNGVTNGMEVKMKVFRDGKQL